MDVGSVLLFWVVFSVVVAGAHLFAARAAPPVSSSRGVDDQTRRPQSVSRSSAPSSASSAHRGSFGELDSDMASTALWPACLAR